MLTGMICGIVIVCALAEGAWGTAAVFCGLLALLLWMRSEERKSIRAWRNARRYWYERW